MPARHSTRCSPRGRRKLQSSKEQFKNIATEHTTYTTMGVHVRRKGATALAAIGLIAGPLSPVTHAFHTPSSATAETSRARARRGRRHLQTSPFHNAAVHSPLFTSTHRHHRRIPGLFLGGRGRLGGRRSDGSGIGSSTELNVLTTPEAIFEETSTQNLLDDLIDESVRTSARRPVMMQFDPSSGWIWKRWRGTVFSETWPSVVRNMCLALCVSLLHTLCPGFINRTLSGFDILWGQLLSVTTFTLTFFLNQSYALWRKCYELSRRLQGRLNDLGMTMAAHAARTVKMTSGGGGADGEGGVGGSGGAEYVSRYTTESSQILQVMARYIRMFNLMTYASFTRSHRPILTPRGMRRLVERGLLTAREREVLVDSELPPTQRHNAVLMWIIRIFQEGREAGHIEGGAGFEQQFMEKCHVIRAQYGAIGDELSGRMPLAYAHIVQVLVDVVLWMYPFMAISRQMSVFLTVLGTGLLTMFYQGLFDLSKQFLDPYDNENYGKGEDPLCVDTLIAESNSGSMRWFNGLNKLPFSAQLLQRGQMDEYVLPLGGYTVAEVEEIELRREAERIRMEKEAAAEDDADRDVMYDEETIAEILDESSVNGDAVINSPAPAAETPAAVANIANDTIAMTSSADIEEELEAITAMKESSMKEEVGKAVWGMEDRVEECLGNPEDCLDEPEAFAVAEAEQDIEEFAEVEQEDDVETASAIAAAAEAEFLETEAILNAPPNADFLPEEDLEDAKLKEKKEVEIEKQEKRMMKKKKMDAGSETLLVAKGVMEIAEEVEAELEEKSLREADGLNALDMDFDMEVDMTDFQVGIVRPNGGNPNGSGTTKRNTSPPHLSYQDSLDTTKE